MNAISNNLTDLNGNGETERGAGTKVCPSFAMLHSDYCLARALHDSLPDDAGEDVLTLAEERHHAAYRALKAAKPSGIEELFIQHHLCTVDNDDDDADRIRAEFAAILTVGNRLIAIDDAAKGKLEAQEGADPIADYLAEFDRRNRADCPTPEAEDAADRPYNAAHARMVASEPATPADFVRKFLVLWQVGGDPVERITDAMLASASRLTGLRLWEPDDGAEVQPN